MIYNSISKKNFAFKLKCARKKKKLTQRELSELSDVSISQITLYEQGKNLPGTDTLFLLCSALEVSSDHLLGLN